MHYFTSGGVLVVGDGGIDRRCQRGRGTARDWRNARVLRLIAVLLSRISYLSRCNELCLGLFWSRVMGVSTGSCQRGRGTARDWRNARVLRLIAVLLSRISHLSRCNELCHVWGVLVAGDAFIDRRCQRGRYTARDWRNARVLRLVAVRLSRISYLSRCNRCLTNSCRLRWMKCLDAVNGGLRSLGLESRATMELLLSTSTQYHYDNAG